MSMMMIVCMTMQDESWTERYFSEVPAILADHGGRQLSGGRAVELLEGEGPPPDRAAIFEFPDGAAVKRFMEDERYQPHLLARLAGSNSQIYLFENIFAAGRLV
jgi:uncharacterized protein (DUF1330 family)